jgi:sugar phosphate isomerase/epimerase
MVESISDVLISLPTTSSISFSILSDFSVSLLATGLYWSYTLTSDNEKIREKAKSIVKKQLDAASLLGVDTILVVPGAVGVDFVPDSEVIAYDVAYERALEAMKELAPYAEIQSPIGTKLKNVEITKIIIAIIKIKINTSGI